MVAFTMSLVVMAAMTAGVLWYAGRRPQGTPVSWGEAMLAATYVFGMMFVAYGVVPHQWITWADTELQWGAQRLLLTAGEPIIRWDWWPNDWWIMSELNRIPFNVSYQKIRDIIVVVIYVAFLAGQIWLWSVWQRRGERKAPETPVSAYGRPLVRKA